MTFHVSPSLDQTLKLVCDMLNRGDSANAHQLLKGVIPMLEPQSALAKEVSQIFTALSDKLTAEQSNSVGQSTAPSNLSALANPHQEKSASTTAPETFDPYHAGFKPYIIDKNVDGTQFQLIIGDPIGADWYTNLHQLSPQMKFMFYQMIRSDDVILEAGAHHGFTAILMSKWLGPKGRVVSFEASPPSAQILADNIKLNRLTNVTVEPKAVSDNDRGIRVTLASNCQLTPEPSNSVHVESTTIDHYQSLRPTLLKLDVEGHELSVLRGAKQVLQTRPKLEIEVHVKELHDYGCRAQDIVEMLSGYEYAFWLQKSGKEVPFPYNGEVLDNLNTNQVHLYALPK